MVDPYITALERALPVAILGQRFAVLDRHSPHPDTPVAVFSLEDDAYEWARDAYGSFEGFEFRMPSGIEVQPVGVPGVQRP